MEQVKFRNWVDEEPDESLSALLALWRDGDISVSDRVRAFADLLPRSASAGVGTRTTIASVLLMGLDAQRYPPFRTTLFDEAYQRTGYASRPTTTPTRRRCTTTHSASSTGSSTRRRSAV